MISRYCQPRVIKFSIKDIFYQFTDNQKFIGRSVIISYLSPTFNHNIMFMNELSHTINNLSQLLRGQKKIKKYNKRIHPDPEVTSQWAHDVYRTSH